MLLQAVMKEHEKMVPLQDLHSTHVLRRLKRFRRTSCGSASVWRGVSMRFHMIS